MGFFYVFALCSYKSMMRGVLCRRDYEESSHTLSNSSTLHLDRVHSYYVCISCRRYLVPCSVIKGFISYDAYYE